MRPSGEQGRASGEWVVCPSLLEIETRDWLRKPQPEGIRVAVSKKKLQCLHE